MAGTPVYPAAPNSGVVTILPADTTTKKTLFTAGASGGRVHALNVATDDSALNTIQVWITISAVDYLLGSVAVPATAGSVSTVASVNVLAALASVIDPAGYLVLKASAIIKVSMVSTVTAAKTVYVAALGADF